MVTIPGFIGILVLFGAIYGSLFLIISSIYKKESKIFNNTPKLSKYSHFINNTPLLGPLTFIMIWLSFEYLTNFSEFSFPWFSVAYGLKNSLLLLQLLEIGGLPLLGLMIFIINYFIYLAIKPTFCPTKIHADDSIEPETIPPVKKSSKKIFFFIALGILFVWYLIGGMRLNYVQKNTKKHDLSISMIQGNIRQDIKWEDATLDTTFVIYETLTREAVETDQPDLVVFPESALPVYLFLWREHYIRLMRLVQDIDTPIFLGFLYAESGIKYRGQNDPFLYYNTANLFHPITFEDKNYFKNILVPFGERFPFLHLFPFMWSLDFGQANFERGDSAVLYNISNSTKEVFRFTPLICFEIVFPLHLRKVWQEHNPDFWMAITNDAWFGKSIGTHQHAVMAAYRTIETRKAVFRTANTGYSFFTTPDGNIHQITELFDTTFVTGNLHTFDYVSPYLKWGYKIPYLFLVYFLFLFIIILYLNKFAQLKNEG